MEVKLLGGPMRMGKKGHSTFRSCTSSDSDRVGARPLYGGQEGKGVYPCPCAKHAVSNTHPHMARQRTLQVVNNRQKMLRPMSRPTPRTTTGRRLRRELPAAGT